MPGKDTIGEALFVRLGEALGGKATEIEGSALRLHGEGGLVAEGTVEPLYRWTPGRIEWTTTRPELVRKVPPPPLEQAAEMAIAMANRIDAVGVVAERPAKKGEPFPYFAVTALRVVRPAPGDERDATAKRAAHEALAQLAEHMISMMQRYGSSSARVLRHDVAEHAAFVRGLATYVAPGLPIEASLRAIAGELDVRAVRAGIPTDEPLRVAAEIRAAALAWGRTATA